MIHIRVKGGDLATTNVHVKGVRSVSINILAEYPPMEN